MKTLRRIITGVALAAALAVPVLMPAPAQAWWHAGWGWHGGWGWHPGYNWGWRVGFGWGWWAPGVVIAAPPVAVAAPAYVPPYHWVPGYYAPNGAWVPAHWGYY